MDPKTKATAGEIAFVDAWDKRGVFFPDHIEMKANR
jgi:hypothetical protein